MRSTGFLFTIILFMTLVAGCQRGGMMYEVSISPSEVVVAEGTSHQFAATAIFTDGSVITWTSAVNWSISPDPGTTGTATIGTSFGYFGLVTSTTGTGDFTVTATDVANNLVATAHIYVREPEIRITPTNAFMPVNNGLNTNYSHQFRATGTMMKSAGTLTTTVDLTSSSTWTVSDVSFASVSASGLVTAGAAPGPASLTATYLTSSGTTTVNVIPETLTALVISAPSPTMAPAATLQFTAKGTFATSPDLDYTSSVTWFSSDTGRATISASGLVSATTDTTKTGQTTITAADPISGKTSNPVTVTVQ